MRSLRIDIVCLQETRALKAEYYTANGYRIVLSGSEEAKRSWAGIGFIIAPWCQHRVCSFLQYSDRLASIKVKEKGGEIAIICCYAPHNLRPYDERQQFYESLGKLYDSIAVNGPKCIFGDFNARLGNRRRGEEDIGGPFSFGTEAKRQVDTPNQDLLVEFCFYQSCVIANTLEYAPPDQKAIFMEPGTTPKSSTTGGGFAMLDLVLVPAGWVEKVVTVSSVRDAALASDQFLVYCKLDCGHVPSPARQRPTRKDLSSLQQPPTRQRFAQTLAHNNCTEDYDE